jgi:hypothetical protein
VGEGMIWVFFIWISALVVIFMPTVDSQLDDITQKVIQCESHGDSHAVGDNGEAYGILQFHKPTFDWMKHLAGHDEYQYTNPNDQILLFKWAVMNGYGDHWVCFKKLGLTKPMPIWYTVFSGNCRS